MEDKTESKYSEEMNPMDYDEEDISDEEYDSSFDDDKIKELMKMEYIHPEEEDPDFQEKIYKKREYYYHKMQERPIFENYEQIHQYRDKICKRKVELLEQQAFLANLINPDTPYRGILVFHGVVSAPVEW